MKERFTVTVDEKIAKWLDDVSEGEKVFSSRSHAIEFCVNWIMKLGIAKIVLVRWGKDEIEPLFFSKPDIDMIDRVAKNLKVTNEEATRILLYRGLEAYERESQKTLDIEDETIKKVKFK
jgi:hypothetical protein